jgi:hypothetical protein
MAWDDGTTGVRTVVTIAEIDARTGGTAAEPRDLSVAGGPVAGPALSMQASGAPVTRDHDVTDPGRTGE